MLLFMEGFDFYAVSDATEGEKRYGGGNFSAGMVAATGRFGTGQALEPNTNTRFIRKAFPANIATGVMGVAFFIRGAASTLRNQVFVLQDDTSCQLALCVNAAGNLILVRSTTANILATSSFVLATELWYYIEMKWEIANSTAADVVVKVNGTTVITLAAGADTQATANAYVTHWKMGATDVDSGANSLQRMDDIYIADLTGSGNAIRDFTGDVRVTTLRPTGNGNSTQLLNTAGNSTNNYLYVDDPTDVDDDSTYVESSTVGNKDTYAHGDLAANITNVLAVAINTSARKTDAGTREISHVTRMGSTDYNSANVSLASTYVINQTIQESRPSDSAAWASSDVNSAEFGVEVEL